jgi:hypothetical protein
VLQPGAVQQANAFRAEKISVGNEGGDAAVGADTPNQLVQFGVQKRLAAAEGDDLSSQGGEKIDAAQHFGCRYGT